MTFADLAPGDAVFLDANVLVYHFTLDPVWGPACGQLLQRIESQEVRGFASTHILSEMAHRVMAAEAITAFGWSLRGIAQRLRGHPADVRRLVGFRQAVERTLLSRIQVVTIPPALIAAAAAVSQQTGLLSNDALLVAVMQANGLTNLASTDTDFDGVSGITRYEPA